MFVKLFDSLALLNPLKGLARKVKGVLKTFPAVEQKEVQIDGILKEWTEESEHEYSNNMDYHKVLIRRQQYDANTAVLWNTTDFQFFLLVNNGTHVLVQALGVSLLSHLQ